jgi:hypothetical protein
MLCFLVLLLVIDLRVRLNLLGARLSFRTVIDLSSLKSGLEVIPAGKEGMIGPCYEVLEGAK